MKKKTTRSLWLILVIAALCAILVSCGSDPSSPGGDSSGNNSAETIPPRTSTLTLSIKTPTKTICSSETVTVEIINNDVPSLADVITRFLDDNHIPYDPSISDQKGITSIDGIEEEDGLIWQAIVDGKVSEVPSDLSNQKAEGDHIDLVLTRDLRSDDRSDNSEDTYIVSSVTLTIRTESEIICSKETYNVVAKDNDAATVFRVVNEYLDYKGIPYTTDEFAGFSIFTSIDGFEEDGDTFWQVLVNGKEPDGRYAALEITDGDDIEFILTENISEFE